MDASATSNQFDQVKVSRNLSQLIRSNTPQYWSYMKRQADLGSLQRYLPFEGMLAGDPHMGNFSTLPLKLVLLESRDVLRAKCKASDHFLDLDIDDYFNSKAPDKALCDADSPPVRARTH